MASLTCEVDTMLVVQNVDLGERGQRQDSLTCEQPCYLELLLIHKVNDKWQVNSRPNHKGELNMKHDIGAKPLA